MTDRAAFLRTLPDAPERRPGGEQPNRGSVSFVGYPLSLMIGRGLVFNAARKAWLP